MKANNDEFDGLLAQAVIVKDKITKVDEKIKIQLAEIEKSELLIEQLRECHSRQKETFDKLLENKKSTIGELNRLISDMKSIDSTFDAGQSNLLIENCTVENEGKQGVEVDESQLVCVAPNLKRNVSEYDTEIYPKKKKFVDEADSAESYSNLVYPLAVSKNTKQIITKILFSNDALFVCGSQGLLVKFSDEGKKIFQTRTSEVIKDITIFTTHMVAFTEYTVIIFGDISDSYHRSIKKCYANIGQSHLYHSSIYFPLSNGEVWNFNILNENYQKCFSEKHSEIIAILKYKSFIVLLEKGGRVLQRISSKNKEIEYLRGSKSIGSMSFNLWYSYSDFQLWILSQQDCSIIQSLSINNEISMATCNSHKLVILDKIKTVYLFNIEKDQLNMNSTILLQQFNEINTLTITESNEIFIAEKNRIHQIQI